MTPTEPTSLWLSLREDLTNPAELSQARGEAIRAILAWARKWRTELEKLPDAAMAELADAVGGVVDQHRRATDRNPVAECRAEGRDATVRELSACVYERNRMQEGDAPVRRGRPDGSAWHDFLDRSGDLRQYDGESISEEEKAHDAAREVCAPPSEPTRLATQLLAEPSTPSWPA